MLRTLIFFENEMEIDRELFQKGRKEIVHKRRVLKSHGCGLKHLLSDSPTCSNVEKERIWKERLVIST